MAYRSGRTADPAAGMRVVVEGTRIYALPDMFAIAQELALAAENHRPIAGPPVDRTDIIAGKAFQLPDDMVAVIKATLEGFAVVVDHELPAPRP